MPLDPRILLQGQAPQLNDTMDTAVKAQSLRDSQAQNMLLNRKIQQLDSSDAKANKLSMITRAAFNPATGKIDNAKLRQGLAQEGMMSEIQDVDKQEIDARQQSRLELSAKVDNALKTIDYSAQLYGGVKDQASLDAANAEIGSMIPGAVARLPKVYTPAAIKSVLDTAYTAKDKMIADHQKWDESFSQQKFNADQQNKKADRDVTMRGQDQSALNRASPPPMTVGQQYDYDKKLKEDSLAKQTTISGLQDAIDNIDRLKGVQAKTPTGPIVGSAPIASIRKALPGQDADNLASLEKGYAEMSLKLIGSLKQGGTTLGALSEKEGQWLKDASESIATTGTVNQEMLDRGKRLAEDQMSRLGASPKVNGQTSGNVRTQTNKRTGQRRQSTDGGQTWQVIN